jgi:hypothetical protein
MTHKDHKRQYNFLTDKNPFLVRKKNPLLDCTVKVMKTVTNENRRINIKNRYRSFDYTYFCIPIILKRIREDAKHVSFYYAKGYYYRSKKDVTTLSEWKMVRCSEYLDVSNFFIHTCILMDEMCKLAMLFLENNEPRSFSKHKKSLMTNENFSDKYYSGFVVKKTNWYESELKDIRDDLVVHTQPLDWTDSAVGDELISVSKVSRYPHTLVAETNKLVDKYSTKLDFQIERNYYSSLSWLTNNKNRLSTDDQSRLEMIKKKSGQILPSIDQVSKQVFEYISFISNHFKNR